MDTGAAICFDLQKCISPPAGVCSSMEDGSSVMLYHGGINRFKSSIKSLSLSNELSF